MDNTSKTININYKRKLTSEISYRKYQINGDVVFITLWEKNYPRKLSAAFISEIQKEYESQYPASEVAKVDRGYLHIKFDNFIQKTKKSFMDINNKQNLSKVTEELSDATRIMTKNVTELLIKGEKLQQLGKKADDLVMGTQKYLTNTKNLNAMLFWRTYGPFMIIGTVALLYLIYRFVL